MLGEKVDLNKYLIQILLFVVFTSSTFSNSNNHFIENKGQWPEEVLFQSNINGLTTWITKDGVIYDHYQIEVIKEKQDPFLLDEKDNSIKHGHIVKNRFVGASQDPTLKKLNRKDTYFNYFKGQDESKWASNVALYEEVIIEDIYAGIDKRYYFDSGLIRYDFIVEPGADITQIQMEFNGQLDLSINDDGELELLTQLGEVTQGKIFAYQEVNGKKIEINASFIKSSQDLVSFKLGEYNEDLALVIDPLIWSTFIGGTGSEEMYSVNIDNDGDIFLVGYTSSADYPTTAGAYDQTHNTSNDIIISKFDQNGTSLVWSTYIGGSSSDLGLSFVFDSNEDLYLTGETNSANFPVTGGAYDQTQNGSADVFCLKLSNDGSTLNWASFIGGSGDEWGRRIILSTNDNVIITGYTDDSATDFPTTGGAYDQTHNGLMDAFVCEISNDGTSLNWSTFIGGDNDETGQDLYFNSNNDLIIVGHTIDGTTDFPTTAGVYDQTHNGNRDVFVCNLSNDGTSLNWSTFIGGSNDDRISKFILDNNDDIYLACLVISNDFPTTAGVYDQTHNGNFDINLSKISSDGTNLEWSTFIGGSENDIPYDIKLLNNHLFYCGYSLDGATDYPTTTGAYDETHNGNYDVVIGRITNDGSNLKYSTFIGGDALDLASEFTFANDQRLIVLGYSNDGTTDYPTTTGVYDETHNGSNDGFTMEFLIVTEPEIYIENNVASINSSNQILKIFDGGSSTSYNLEYGTSSGNYTSIKNSIISESSSTQTESVNITGLSANTTYYYQVTAWNLSGTTTSNEYSFTTSQNSDLDSDGDGILDSDEDKAPNSGDGNGDGIQDALQQKVATVYYASLGIYVTIEAIDCTSLSDVGESDTEETTEYTFPFGAVKFTVPCSSANIKLYYHSTNSLDGFFYRKKKQNGQWFDYEDKVFGTAEIGGNTIATVTLYLEDGGEEDYDGSSNGVIVDPGGPVIPVAANIPVWDEWWFLLAILIIVGIVFKFRN